MVLVVDDYEAQSLLVAQILAADPHLKVLSTADSADALKKAELHEPDIIISDYYMPGMDGAELCKRIKQHPILREHMFIMLTSASAVTEKVKLLESGADELLTKPIHPDELVSRVKVCTDDVPAVGPEVGKTEIIRNERSVERELSGDARSAGDPCRSARPRCRQTGRGGQEDRRMVR